MATTRSFAHYNPSGRHGAPAVRCVIAGRGGAVIRHALGCGLADYRWIRCFARYTATERVAGRAHDRGILRRFLNEIVTWREED